MRRAFWGVTCAIVLVACGEPPPRPDAAVDAGERCRVDPDCDDGVFCTGAEICEPESPEADQHGCIAGTAPCASGESCDEAADECTTITCDTPDADGDGIDADACGGLDCDDGDAAVHAGATEVCDPAGLDEDCDPTTLGVRDNDADGFLSAGCCNGTACGDDCDDGDRRVNPGSPEVCGDGINNDCDLTTSDTSGAMACYVDGDRDGYAAMGAVSIASCTCGDGSTSTPPIPGQADCNDASISVNPANPEVCSNAIDDDCDGMIDEAGNDWYVDCDGDGHGDPSIAPIRQCISPGRPPGCLAVLAGYVTTAPDDCDDHDATVYPLAPELCDGRDTACASATMPGGARPEEDLDGDLFAAPTADCSGGPYPRTDCDDANPAIHPGAPEICDRRYSDCTMMGTVRPAEDADADGHAPAGSSVCDGGPLPEDDCDDTEATIHPGADELCDRVDNVCATGGGARPVEDADGDMHAPAGTSLCVDGPGTLPRDDCRDDSAITYPGAPNEICDGIDNDCDATTDDEPASSSYCAGVLPGTSCIAGECAGVVDVAAGAGFTCAVHHTGRVSCWGQVAGTIRVAPVDIAGVDDATDADAVTHACVVRDLGDEDRANDAASCFGTNTQGELGDGTTTTRTAFVPVVGLSNVRRVRVGDGLSCALLWDGGVRCWGRGGSLGDGTSTPSSVPVPVAGVTSAVDLAVGSTHACALLAGGTVSCWGANSTGQLGDGTMTARTSPTAVLGISDAVSLGAGGIATCAVRAGGAVACWGQHSAFGSGGAGIRTSATAVTGVTGAVEIQVGTTTCARTSIGQVVCWGDNGHGQLGNGAWITPSASTRVTIGGLTGAVQVSTKGSHVCARRATRDVVCWGEGTNGQLGSGETGTTTLATTIPGISDATAVGVYYPVSCASRAGGVSCVGTASAIDGMAGYYPSPAAHSSLPRFTQLRYGYNYQCAVASGRVYCAGDNSYRQMGVGTTGGAGAWAPVSAGAAAGVSDFIEVATGGRHVCARRAGGAVICWGDNAQGQLGIATTSGPSDPVVVPSLTATSIAAGFEYSCAARSSTTIACWGYNFYGQLGDGTTTTRTSPTNVPSFTTSVLGISAAYATTCARMADGTMRCWGNVDGTGRTAPITITGLTNVTQISAQMFRWCVTHGASAAVRCYDTHMTASSAVDTGITGATGWVGPGERHVCARVGTTVVCAGDDGNAQCGDGRRGSDRASPFTIPWLP